MDKFIEKYYLGYNSLSNFDIIDVVKQVDIPHFRGGVYEKYIAQETSYPSVRDQRS